MGLVRRKDTSTDNALNTLRAAGLLPTDTPQQVPQVKHSARCQDCKYRLGGYGDYGTTAYGRRHANDRGHHVIITRDGATVRVFNPQAAMDTAPVPVPHCEDRVRHSLALCNCDRPTTTSPPPY